MKKRIGILLVDDHEVTRQGLQQVLGSERGMKLLGSCASAEQALSEVKRLCPDIVLMDIDTPGMGGIEATRRLKRNGMDCDAAVIVLAERSNYLVEALEAGAAGYLLKDVKWTELVQVIRQVYRNEHSPGIDAGLDETAVDLIIPPPADAAQVVRFIDQVENRLQTSILQTTGSWDWGTVVTIRLKREHLSDLPDNLSNIPAVGRVEQEGSSRKGFFKFLNLSRIPLNPRANPRERLRISLK